MNTSDFLKQHLGCSELPQTLSLDVALEAIRLAALQAADQTSDFDSERIGNLRRTLNSIAETSTDSVSAIAAKRALLNDEAAE